MRLMPMRMVVVALLAGGALPAAAQQQVPSASQPTNPPPTEGDPQASVPAEDIQSFDECRAALAKLRAKSSRFVNSICSKKNPVTPPNSTAAMPLDSFGSKPLDPMTAPST